MARTKKLSDAAKRRALEAHHRRLQREIQRVEGQLEHCMICDAQKLEKQVRALETRQASERKKLAAKLGVDPRELEAKTAKKASKKAAKKKSAKKKAAKKATKKVAKKAAKKASKVSTKKTSKKKTSKKTSSKKTSKRASKKAPPRAEQISLEGYRE